MGGNEEPEQSEAQERNGSHFPTSLFIHPLGMSLYKAQLKRLF